MMPPEQRTHLQRAGIALAGVVLLVVGFSAGRFSGPSEVREVERVVYRDLLTEDITRGYTFAKTVQKTVWRNVVTATTDAGTTTTDLSIEHHGATTAATGTETGKRTEDHQGERETEKTTKTLPDWRLGALVGGRFSGGPAGLVVGGIAERRIIGGISLGLWGMAEVETTKPAIAGASAGGVLSVEF